MRILLAL